MSPLKENNFIVVIRSARERTRDVCKQIILNELPEQDLKIIELTPFEEALRESYRVGIKSKKEWLVTIDADVLPKKEFLSEISSLTQKVPDDLFAFKPMIYDKILIKHRLAGLRVYRTKFLRKAYEFIPLNGEQIRPEEYTVSKMEKEGYKTKIFEYVGGLHDFEQYYRDIYRKAFFHSTKHVAQVAELMDEWKMHSFEDLDYKVMVKGAIDGLLSEKKPKADLRFFEKMSRKALEELGLEEKEPLDPADIESFVEEKLSNVEPFSKEYTWNGIKKNIMIKGFLNGTIYTAGHILEAIGVKLKEKTEH